MHAVLFDLDGTLVDTRHIYAESYRHAFAQELAEPPTFEEFIARRPSSERLFLLEWYGSEVGERLHRRMLERYEATAAELHGVLYDGVAELVRSLVQRRTQLAIVTGKSRRAFEVTRRLVDLSAFDVVVVEDDVPRAKPDPAGIRRALQLLGVRDAAYVGDTPMDAEAAIAAGVQPAAALWARTPEDRARVAGELHSDIWALHAPGDLLERLASL